MENCRIFSRNTFHGAAQGPKHGEALPSNPVFCPRGQTAAHPWRQSPQQLVGSLRAGVGDPSAHRPGPRALGCRPGPLGRCPETENNVISLPPPPGDGQTWPFSNRKAKKPEVDVPTASLRGGVPPPPVRESRPMFDLVEVFGGSNQAAEPGPPIVAALTGQPIFTRARPRRSRDSPTSPCPKFENARLRIPKGIPWNSSAPGACCPTLTVFLFSPFPDTAPPSIPFPREFR